jgi:hypothetical protein
VINSSASNNTHIPAINSNPNKSIKWLGLILLYTFSFGLALQYNLFWDDWTMINASKDAIQSEFLDSGYVTFYLFLNVIWPITVAKAILMKWIIFIGYIIAGFMTYYILKTVAALRDHAFIITAISLLLPFNHARVAFAVINYVYNYSLFFIAFGLLVYYLKNGNKVARIISLILFFLSFNMNSMFFFFMAVILYIINYEYSKKGEINILDIALKYTDFAFMCVLFLTVKYFFFPSKGVYTGYNSIELGSLLYSPFVAIEYIWIAFSSLIGEILHFIKNYFAFTLISCYVIFLYLKVIRIEIKQINTKAYLALALFLLWLACLPYAIVGRIPSFESWNSRSQLLLPIGSALLIVVIVNSIAGRKRIIQLLAYSLILGCSISYNFKSMLDYEKDWFKQLSVIHYLKTNTDIKNASFIYVKDNLPSLNAKRRVHLFYEYSGMLKNTFGDKKRFMTHNLTDTSYIGKVKNYSQFNITDYKKTGNEVLLTINPGKLIITDLQAAKMMLYKLNDTEKFNNCIEQIVELKTEPFNGSLTN